MREPVDRQDTRQGRRVEVHSATRIGNGMVRHARGGYEEVEAPSSLRPHPRHGRREVDDKCQTSAADR